MGRPKKRRSQKDRIELLENYTKFLKVTLTVLNDAIEKLDLTQEQEMKLAKLLGVSPVEAESSFDQKNYTPLESLENPPHLEDTHSPEHTVPDPDSTP